MGMASVSKHALARALRRILTCPDCEGGVVRGTDIDGEPYEIRCGCQSHAAAVLKDYDAPDAPPPSSHNNDEVPF